MPNVWYADGELPLGVIAAVCELTAVHRIPSNPQHFPIFDYPTEDRLGSYSIVLPPFEYHPHFGDSHELDFGDYTPGRFAWILTNIRALENPVPCRGYQQLWNVPADALAQINAQL